MEIIFGMDCLLDLSLQIYLDQDIKDYNVDIIQVLEIQREHIRLMDLLLEDNFYLILFEYRDNKYLFLVQRFLSALMRLGNNVKRAKPEQKVKRINQSAKRQSNI